MSAAPELAVILELSRTADPQDPYAFRFEPQTYTLRTPGGGRQVLEIDWSAELLADLEAVRRPDRDPVVVQRLGQAMAHFLERASWSSQAQAIAAAHDAGQRVTITIRSNAAELYALPWELVVLPGRGQHLGSLPGVLLRYERPETRTASEPPTPRAEGGRILLAWSAAGGAVPAGAHEAALRRACGRGHPEGEAALEVLANSSVRSLADALTQAARAQRPFAVLHVLCHGGRAGQATGLVLDGDGDGRAVTVAADTWRTLLGPHARYLRLVVLAACEGGHAGEPGNQLGSVGQALHAAGVAAVVASRYPLSRTGSNTLAETLYEALLAEHGSLECALLQVRTQLALDPVHLDWAGLQLYARADDGADTRPFVFRPYRGLLAFEAAQTPFFYGREAERAEIVGDLEALIHAGKPRLLVVAGASGTGKSSLVRAGAVPDIMAARGGAWEHAILRPGTDPLGTLEATLAARDPARPLLLVVDQLEEIFTHTKDREVRLAFAHRLWAVASEDTQVACILALRVDFLGRCGELRLDEAGTRLDAVAYDEAHRVFVAQMAPAQLLAAITRPAERAGLVLQEGLAERIVAEVGVEPGALPLMQYTLDRLWQARRGRELTLDEYEQLGGVVGSLECRADALLEDLPDEELHHARRMLTQLVGLGDDDTGDTRRRVPVEQLWPDAPHERRVAEGVLRRFVDERLLVRDDRTQGGATVEIAHEALIRRWDRLREWLGDERERRIGRYIVLEQLHEARREEVYVGYDPELDRRVTIRLLRVGRRGAEERARLRDQARSLARLSHPSVLAVYDVGVARGHVYMAMERAEGVALREWVVARPRVWTEIVAVFGRLADGLAAAHRLGVLHRGFAPEAVLVEADGTPRIVDFTLDRRVEHVSSGRSAGTIAARMQARSSGAVVAATVELEGSLGADASLIASMTESSVASSSAYVAPELLRGREAGPAGDQFGFCVSLYEVLHGERPFAGNGMAAFVQSVTSREATLSPRHPIPEALRKILLRGLAADPEQRWPSMEALGVELRKVIEPPGRRRLAGVLALVGLGLGGVVLTGLATSGDEPDPASVQPATMASTATATASVGAQDVHAQLAASAASLVVLAEDALARGDHGGAREHARLALTLAEALASTPDQLARARFVLAQALWNEPAQQARARSLAQQARESYALLGEAEASARVEAWLATRE